MAACVVGDLTRHPRRLRRVDFASYLDPPAHGAGVQSLQGPPRRVPAQIDLAGLLCNYGDLRAGENVHDPALDPALLALRRLEPVYGIVEFPSPKVDERGQLLHLGVGRRTFGPGLITRRTHRLVGVLSPDNGPLLRFSLCLGLAQLPLEGLYRRGHPPFPLNARLHDHSTARRPPSVLSVAGRQNALWRLLPRLRG